jgi:hypothetical protein
MHIASIFGKPTISSSSKLATKLSFIQNSNFPRTRAKQQPIIMPQKMSTNQNAAQKNKQNNSTNHNAALNLSTNHNAAQYSPLITMLCNIVH